MALLLVLLIAIRLLGGRVLGLVPITRILLRVEFGVCLCWREIYIYTYLYFFQFDQFRSLYYEFVFRIVRLLKYCALWAY